jgi:hypothetical protein
MWYASETWTKRNLRPEIKCVGQILVEITKAAPVVGELVAGVVVLLLRCELRLFMISLARTECEIRDFVPFNCSLSN